MIDPLNEPEKEEEPTLDELKRYVKEHKSMPLMVAMHLYKLLKKKNICPRKIKHILKKY